MITFILPGYSLKNKNWALETAQKLKLPGEIRPVLWEHWVDPEKKFIASDKADDVIDVLLKDRCNLLAKSIGTLVAAHVIKKIPERIDKVIFCGVPLNDLREENKKLMAGVLKNFPAEKIICYQNQNDPHGSFGDVKKFLGGIKSDVNVISKPRADHEYPYFEDFQGYLVKT